MHPLIEPVQHRLHQRLLHLGDEVLLVHLSGLDGEMGELETSVLALLFFADLPSELSESALVSILLSAPPSVCDFFDFGSVSAATFIVSRGPGWKSANTPAFSSGFLFLVSPAQNAMVITKDGVTYSLSPSPWSQVVWFPSSEVQLMFKEFQTRFCSTTTYVTLGPHMRSFQAPLIAISANQLPQFAPLAPGHFQEVADHVINS